MQKNGNIEKLGERIKQARINAEISQYAFAKKINVTRNAISNYEKNNRRPDIALFVKIADVLNVSYDYLLGYSDTPIREYHDTRELTGLPDEAIEVLKTIANNARNEKSNPKYNSNLLETLSYLIVTEKDYSILSLINRILTPIIGIENAFNTSSLVYGPSDMYYADLLKLSMQLNELRKHKEAENSSTTGRKKK